jgi:hypothetical protein
MSAPAVVRTGVGVRNVQLFALNSTGSPNASSTSFYAGVQLEGAKVMTINDPEPRQITHTGDDNVLQLDQLPATEAMTGEITVAKTNDSVDALLTGKTSFTVGEAKLLAIGNSNLAGSEVQVGMMIYRQALDASGGSSDGARRWEFRIFPKCFLYPRENTWNDSPQERSYTLRPQIVAAHLWETAFASGTEGVSRTQGFRGISQYKPKIVSALGDNSTTVFSFPTGFAAADTAKIVVWVSGVLKTLTTHYTVTTSAITFVSAPASGARIVVFYETN